MDEQARVRFRLTEKSARRAPRNIVTTPREKIIVPNVRFVTIAFVAVIKIPKTPTLVRIPERRAEAGDGATGCALGSQTCTGNIPALAPNPSRIHIPAARILRRQASALRMTGAALTVTFAPTPAAPSRTPSVAASSIALFISAKYKVPTVACMRRRPIKRMRPPMIAIKRYV